MKKILLLCAFLWVDLPIFAKGQVIEIQEDEEISFVIGQTQVVRTAIDTYYMTLIELNDSRCPEDVVCVWQGVARAVFTVVSKRQTEESLLVVTTLDEGPMVFQDLEISLSEVTPYPNTQMPESEKVVRLILHPTFLMPVQPEMLDSAI